VPPITIQPVENCAADSNPRRPAPAENVRRITTPPAAEKNAAGVGTNGTVWSENFIFLFKGGVLQ